MGYGDQNNKPVEDIIKAIRPKAVTVFDVVEDAGGKKLTVSVAPVTPIRAESPPRAHCLRTVESLIAYLKTLDTSKTIIFVGTESVSVVLDDKAANGIEEITFHPTQHPTFAAWSARLGRPIAFKDLAVFAQEQRNAVVNPKGHILASMLRQIKAGTKIELQEGIGNGAVNGLLVTTKIQSTDTKKEVELPEAIEVRCPMFLDSEEEDFAFDFIVGATPDGASVFGTLSLPQRDVLVFEQMQKYASKLTSAKVGTVVTGTPHHETWTYLPAPTL